jgi:hypothetical protein
VTQQTRNGSSQGPSREELLEKWMALRDDHERRVATRWGRFLLWLLRKTT